MSDRPVTIAVAMSCFNRRETTLRCIRSLAPQISQRVHLTVHLLDDDSADGTADAVKAEFPETIIIKGDGNRFWGGGMYLAMRSAAETGFDHVLWLNDDVTLKPDAISRMLEAYDAARTRSPLSVVAGGMEDPATGEMSYGGFNRRNAWHPAQLDRVAPSPDTLTPCDTLNGNCVLIPAEVVQRLGPIDPVFVHQLGDIDYGYRLAKAGGQVWLAPGFVGECSPNTGTAAWRKAKDVRTRLRLLGTPRGLPPRSWFTFMWRWGKLLGVAILAGIYVKALTSSPADKTVSVT
jgi:GT2 family glycosyltransferase